MTAIRVAASRVTDSASTMLAASERESDQQSGKCTGTDRLPRILLYVVIGAIERLASARHYALFQRRQFVPGATERRFEARTGGLVAFVHLLPGVAQQVFRIPDDELQFADQFVACQTFQSCLVHGCPVLWCK